MMERECVEAARQRPGRKRVVDCGRRVRPSAGLDDM
jgi:hypothetical protein